MPATAKSKRKYKRLTDRQILRRIDAGTLIVSVFDGQVLRLTKAGEWAEVAVGYTPQRRRPYVRLYWRGRRRGIMLHRLVWIAAHRRPIPPGCEIHHRDFDPTNCCWSNLRCLTKDDHQRIHQPF